MSEEKKNIIAEREKEIQKFWKDNKIFEKTLEATKNGSVYNFYDGPPFATGTTHYGHLVASVMKDAIPRYQTMRGNYVERKWGWDCHGLPIENIAEKALGFKSKKDIEEYGIENFNAFCRSKVLEYVDAWKKTIPRFGRWADMDNPYKTMDLPYMESVWWVFKELYDKGLIYEGYKSMHVCPRCETTLSQQEVSEGYKDIKDLSVTAEFKLVDELNTFVLAWTTTPWTLPGNVALAVGEDIDYVMVSGMEFNLDENESLKGNKIENGIFVKYIVAKNLLLKVFSGGKLSQLGERDNNGNFKNVIKEFKGSELVGKKYKPLFPYYESEEAKEKIKNSENIYTIVSADFVTTEDGTGVVHIAPAYGEDDMNLGKEKNLPMIQNVTMSGHFKDEITDFAGMNVKPADDTQKTDVEIIKYLASKNLLFSKEKYEHSYPHCWRCDTPLINYATSSWFVKVTDVKEKALKLAKDISWSPAHIKEGRFGKWLEGARDWSISRQRFWASVMPIWKCDCGHMEVLGSVEDLKKRSIDNQITKVIFVRHGEAENNVLHINSNATDKHSLTVKGKEQIKEAIKLVQKEIGDSKDVALFSSPVLRTKETAELIAQKLKLEVEFTKEIKEVDFGSWEQKELAGLMNEFDTLPLDEKWSFKNGQTGESQKDLRDRMWTWFEKTVKENNGKTIIIVSHGDPLMALINKIKNNSEAESLASLENNSYIQKGEVRPIYVMTENAMELDLHKDVMDKVYLKCEKCEGKMRRIPDVLDTWFDSGSMPYAQNHYPFENKEKFEKSFPAEFIAEGVDQTRAWFYYLHIISSAIKGSRTFSNVIVNGIVLAEDGKKMAKKLKNYPEPEIVMEKYGADALRYYLLSSPVVSAENMNFSEVGVKEAMQKIIMLTNNILNFYKLYQVPLLSKEGLGEVADVSDKPLFNLPLEGGEKINILDKWLLAKLNLLIEEITKQMEAYDLQRAVRPIQEFIDEFSTWWLRRSRDRFKSENEKDKNEALMIYKFTLTQLSKIMAPFVPFIAEYLYKEVSAEKESVHLENWPEAFKLKDEKVITQMDEVRKIVEMGLASRAEKGIKIRQPLSKLTVYGFNLTNEFVKIIADEVNVKEVVFEKGEPKVELDIEITKELRQEGMVREIIRTINDLRKKQGLSLEDNISVQWHSESDILNAIFGNEKYILELKKNTITEEFVKINLDLPEVNINGESIKFQIKKQ